MLCRKWSIHKAITTAHITPANKHTGWKMMLRTLCFSTYFPDLQGLWAFRLKKKPREVQTSLGFGSEKVRQMQTPHSTCVDAYSEEQTTEPHTAQTSFKGKASFWKLDADSRHKSIAPDERRGWLSPRKTALQSDVNCLPRLYAWTPQVQQIP